MVRSSNTDAMEMDGGDASLSITIERNPPESQLLELVSSHGPNREPKKLGLKI
ncbi:hypothetical protein QJS10_CPB20g00738 [Acorus calamus]|uniref:Uncharacterized protein n=1 Tax=Acorus calamus TaxID=4465 RepID=A0AAV9CBN9_ACOCL|nr:hypothetical protein QJS10_CPB20g00738 [Acorus calamus]